MHPATSIYLVYSHCFLCDLLTENCFLCQWGAIQVEHEVMGLGLLVGVRPRCTVQWFT